jgi:DNA polymerase-3 subunit delta
MQLRADQLEAQLAKGKLAPLYAIHGDEPLLALEAADLLRAAARRAGFDERVVLIAERGFDWGELGHASASLSLFGAKQLIELRIPSGKPGTQGAQAIEACCAKLNPDTLLVVSLPRLDRTAQNSAWFGALSSSGTVLDVYPIERARLPAWIGERLARQSQRASREVLEFLADRVEGNLLAAHQEVQKLALLAPAGELSFDTVRDAVADVARYDAYSASEALLAGDTARYARAIAGLHAEGEAATLVLWALTEDLKALARIQDGVAAGRQIEQLFRENRVWGSRQAAFRSAITRLARRALEEAVIGAAAIDRAIKGVGPGDPWDEFLKLGLRLRAG